MPTQEIGIIITFWQSPPFVTFDGFAVLIITLQGHMTTQSLNMQRGNLLKKPKTQHEIQVQ
jgi:hypothetical protein